MINVLFYVKRKKPLKDGTVPIFVRVTANGTSHEVSMHSSIAPSQWLAVKGRTRGNTLSNKQINSYLEQQEFRLREIEQELGNEGKQISAKAVIARYKGQDEENTSLLTMYREHNAKLAELVGSTVAHNTHKRHETSLKLFEEFLSAKYGKTDIQVKDVSAAVLEDYRHYLMTARKNNNNTMVKYLLNLGKILNHAVTLGIIRQNPTVLLKLHVEEVDKEFLTKEELDVLATKEITVQRLAQVRDIFVFCCYTGLAYADVASLVPDDITTGNEGRQWIRKARTKTRNMCNIPLLSPAQRIIERYSEGCRITGRLLPVLSNQKMNAYLKELATICGIRKQLSTHCARHTFATTVTLANQVSIENVSKMLGHSNIRMTQHYAKILNSSIERDMEKVEFAIAKESKE